MSVVLSGTPHETFSAAELAGEEGGFSCASARSRAPIAALILVGLVAIGRRGVVAALALLVLGGTARARRRHERRHVDRDHRDDRDDGDDRDLDDGNDHHPPPPTTPPPTTTTTTATPPPPAGAEPQHRSWSSQRCRHRHGRALGRWNSKFTRGSRGALRSALVRRQQPDQRRVRHERQQPADGRGRPSFRTSCCSTSGSAATIAEAISWRRTARSRATSP